MVLGLMAVDGGKTDAIRRRSLLLVKSSVEFRFRRCRMSSSEWWWWQRTDGSRERTVLGYLGWWNEHLVSLEALCGISAKTL
jgi:hypothetical protein